MGSSPSPLPRRRAPHYDGAVFRPLAVSACALWLCVTAAPAWAQSPGDPEPPEDPIAAEAQTRYQHGRELYQLGQYTEAVTELERALALDPNEPVLLYNLALVHEKLDHFDDAIGYLRRYRDSGIAGEELERVEATIRRLEGARQHAPAEVVQPRVIHVPVPVEVPGRRPAPPSFGRADALFFVTAAVAGAALATTAVTGAMALSEETEVDRYTVGDDGGLGGREAHVKNANDLALAADVALTVGGVLAVTATLLYALRRGDPEREPAPATRPGVALTPGGALATVAGTF